MLNLLFQYIVMFRMPVEQEVGTQTYLINYDNCIWRHQEKKLMVTSQIRIFLTREEVRQSQNAALVDERMCRHLQQGVGLFLAYFNSTGFVECWVGIECHILSRIRLQSGKNLVVDSLLRRGTL